MLGVPAGIGPVGSRVVRSVLRLLTGQAQIAAWATRGQTMTIPATGIPTAIDGEGQHVEYRLLAGSVGFAANCRAGKELEALDWQVHRAPLETPMVSALSAPLAAATPVFTMDGSPTAELTPGTLILPRAAALSSTPRPSHDRR